VEKVNTKRYTLITDIDHRFDRLPIIFSERREDHLHSIYIVYNRKTQKGSVIIAARINVLEAIDSSRQRVVGVDGGNLCSNVAAFASRRDASGEFEEILPRS